MLPIKETFNNDTFNFIFIADKCANNSFASSSKILCDVISPLSAASNTNGATDGILKLFL